MAPPPPAAIERTTPGRPPAGRSLTPDHEEPDHDPADIDLSDVDPAADPWPDSHPADDTDQGVVPADDTDPGGYAHAGDDTDQGYGPWPDTEPVEGAGDDRGDPAAGQPRVDGPVDDVGAGRAHHRRPPAQLGFDGRAAVGRTLVGTGVLMMLFAAFQVWGTGLVAWHAQRGLEAELAAALAAERPDAIDRAASRDAGEAGDEATVGSGPEGATVPDPAAAAAAPAPVAAVTEGDAIGRIEMPTLGLTRAVVSGVERDDLRRAPGHYPSTALPGHRGNAAIAGHRTTHGAPFADLDLLTPGDPIIVETVEGRFTYEVEGQVRPDGTEVGHRIVDPSAVEVLADLGDSRLTLTACHPKYSAKQRIIVTAVLVGEPVAAPRAPDPLPGRSDQDSADAVQAGSGVDRLDQRPDGDAAAAAEVTGSGPEEALGWQTEAIEPTILWATVNLQIAHAGWVLGRLWRRRTAHVLAGVALVVPLFVFFLNLDRLLPAL